MTDLTNTERRIRGRFLIATAQRTCAADLDALADLDLQLVTTVLRRLAAAGEALLLERGYQRPDLRVAPSASCVASANIVAFPGRQS